MTVGITTGNHPYYPTTLNIPNYVPNVRSTEDVLLLTGGLMAGLIAFCLLVWSLFSSKSNKGSKFKFSWFTICGIMHIGFEGYWLWNRTTIAGQSDLFAELWKEYAHGDSRYLASDELLLTLETITIFVWGPLCLVSSYYILRGSEKQYFFQLVASLCHLFSCSLYYIMDLPEAKHCDPNPFYFWVYFISFNSPWLLVPSSLVYQSYQHISQALTRKHKIQ